MGYASYLILRDGVGEQRKLALGLYASQLALNWAWTPIFFKCHKLGLVKILNFKTKTNNRKIKIFFKFKATAEIGLLAANIAACIWAFYPINKTASYLLVPYLAWVSFASLLTFNIWQRNKGKKMD